MAELGRHLFYDQRLSINGKVACSTCHQQALAFTDGRARAIGATGQAHSRSAMSLVNIADAPSLTWSHPTLHSLEQQSLIPLLGTEPLEMGLRGQEERVLAELSKDPVYRRRFLAARLTITLPAITKALAAFERKIVSYRSPYDRFQLLGEDGAISDAAKRGEALYFSEDGRADCFRCHGGLYPTKTRRKASFQNTGVSKEGGDPGLFKHSGKSEDWGKFKAPSLRNIAVTAPYMHDGSLATLEDVLDHYANHGRSTQDGQTPPNLDPRMKTIFITPQHRRDLIAFLQSLTDAEVLQDPLFSNPWRTNNGN